MRPSRPVLSRLLTILAASAALLLTGGAQAGNRHLVYVDDSGETIEGEAGWLGVRIDDADGAGVRVVSVVDDSPAARAGLEAGDIIVKVDGVPTGDAETLTRSIRQREPGREVTLTVLRDGRQIEVEAEVGDLGKMISERVQAEMQGLRLELEGLHESLGEMHEQMGEMHELRFELQELEQLKELGHLEHLSQLGEKLGQMGHVFVHECEEGDCKGMAWRSRNRPMLGVSLTTTTPELRRHLGGDEESGALVGRVVTGSAAEKAGIEVGDLIVAIEGDDVADADDIRRALQSRGGETVRVDVIREGAPLTLYADLPQVESDDEPPRRRVEPARGPRT